MHISFILHTPGTPENIGAAARAMKTMGFSDLRLIEPCDYLCERARWLAHNAEEILESASVFSDLKSATMDIDFLIGTSSKKRPSKNENISSRKLADLLGNKGKTVQSVGILFGTEDRGLNNAHLADCDILSHVPMKQAQPSLNLAQSVMVYAYELAQLSRAESRQPTRQPTETAYLKLKQNVGEILDEMGMENRRPIRNRIIERLALLSEKDAHLIQSIVTSFQKKFTNSK